ncbi:hypothetical protein [Nocardia beijingensis]|uniref:Uncharacterized protein n=1 Tax=Nocardia beijingensis TaxID=95162 RepID=A0ABW7WK17_9NOCA
MSRSQTVAHGSRERNPVSLSKTVTPLRRLAGIAAAGALVTVPLAAFAATASAETPADQGQIQLVDAPQQGADIDGGPRHFERFERHDGPDRGPDGPRHFEHFERHDGPGGPDGGPWLDGPRQRHFFHVLPPTGSS